MIYLRVALFTVFTCNVIGITPSPTYPYHCDGCSTDLGWGISDVDGVCHCDVEFFDGSDCNGGKGTGVLDSGLTAFIEGSCVKDTVLDKWREVSCYKLDELSIRWYVDRCGSPYFWEKQIRNDTCYFQDDVMSEHPTVMPTNPTEIPTFVPTESDSPTNAPVVSNHEFCNRTYIYTVGEDIIKESGDSQWDEDCGALIETETQAINIVCGCLGKFSQSFANNYLNCELIDMYHGVDLHLACKESIYAGPAGSTAVSRRRNLLEHLSRRQAIAGNMYKVIWAADMCAGRVTPAPTVYPTSFPTRRPTAAPTSPPACTDLVGKTATSESCMCGSVQCVDGEFCISANNQCYSNNVCSSTDGSVILISTCVCGTSGVTCDFLSLGMFLCDQDAATQCYEITQCTETNGDVQLTEWCQCQHESGSYSTCQIGQYCDATGGWCSSYPTCSDVTGAHKTTAECVCSSIWDVCEIGEFCTIEDEPNGCSPYTPAPTAAPTNKWCTDYVYYSEVTALEVCSTTEWGGTDRGYGSMVACNATQQSRLEESYANELFENCRSWCIYDLMDHAESAYIWRPADEERCWKHVTDFTCYNEDNIIVKYQMANKSLSTCPRTLEPTFQPTSVPTTAAPTVSPTTIPTNTPSTTPTAHPTYEPSNNPTSLPSFSPTMNPTYGPTETPTSSPSFSPTANPTYRPTETPTNNPTETPSSIPTFYPTQNPTNSPTEMPTLRPSPRPTLIPSSSPTESPSMSPTQSPTVMPTTWPTFAPTTLSPTLSPTTIYTNFVRCTIIHSVTLDQLSQLAIAIGVVLNLREPEKEVIYLETYVISYERRRLLQSSTTFEIMLDSLDAANIVYATIQTTLFFKYVKQEFNKYGSTLEEFSVESVSGPHCYMCAGTSDNFPIIIIAGVAGGVTALLCYYFFYRFRREVRRRKIAKQVKDMFSSTPGINRCESDLGFMTPPAEKEIQRLFEEDYMDMEGQIEGFTTMGSGEGTARGITEGGSRMMPEGNNILRILSLDELIRGTPMGGCSLSESESDSSDESPEEPSPPSLSPKNSAPDIVGLMNMNVDDIIAREQLKSKTHHFDGIITKEN